MPDPIVSPVTSGPSAPPPHNDETPEPGEEAPLSPPMPVIFTSDQLDSMGLTNCKDGESYTIKVTKTGSDETGSTFEVNGVEPGDGDADDGAMPTPGNPTGDEPPENEGETPGIPGSSIASEDGDADVESKMLGYARKKKSIRTGIPDTKKMRDI